MRNQANLTPFSSTAARADARFSTKNGIIAELLATLRIRDDFRAVIMPCVGGPGSEFDMLRKRGVPARSMFAIERDPDIHAILRRPTPLYAHLRGILTSETPLDSEYAVDEVELLWGPESVTLLYLDFLGQEGLEHAEVLRKIFRLRLLRKRALLVLNFGIRGDSMTRYVNRLIHKRYRLANGKPNPAHAYVDSQIGKANYPTYAKHAVHTYVSRSASEGSVPRPFTTNAFWWE